MSASPKERINSIDMMRGLVMVLMIIDHVRERFYLHLQVTDPMVVETTSPGLFFSRLLAHFCAPTFVFLTGLSAWLYQHNGREGERPVTGFLFKRGLFLIALEVSIVTFSWSGHYQTVYLQVLWAIGCSMIALAALHPLPRSVLIAIGAILILGHNTLTPITFAPQEWGYSLWTLLHDRGYLVIDGPINIKVSYPLLPWIGVIIAGYAVGPLYARATAPEQRQRWLLGLGLAAWLLFALLRGGNIYGETVPWQRSDSVLASIMALVNVTKYPPSLAFLLLTLGAMLLCLRMMERLDSTLSRKVGSVLTHFGGAPMFFYLLHLYILLLMYQIALTLWGANQSALFGVEQLSTIWGISMVLAVILYWPTKRFAAFKRRSQWAWIKYL